LAAVVLGGFISGGALRAADFVVRMQGTRFVPRDITISVGDSITWTNLDFSGHDAVSGTNGVANGFWRTPLFGRGGSARVVFTNVPPGSYGYYCTPHVFVGMVGSVTVLPANAPPTVSFLEPAPGDLVPAGVPLRLSADAEDADGRVVRVDFFGNGSFLSAANLGPFEAVWSSPPPGPLTLTAVAVDDRGATSAPVTIALTALLPPQFVQPPQSTNTLEGSPVSFAVVVTGAPPLHLQWYFQGEPIRDATNAVLVIANATTNDAGIYTVVASNAVGSVTSPPAELFVTANMLPSITLLSPTNGQFVGDRQPVILRAAASDADGTVTQVEFYFMGRLFATVTEPPYEVDFRGFIEGVGASVYAVAVDDRGGRAITPPVFPTVLPRLQVRVSSPAAGTALAVGESVLVQVDTGRTPPPLVALNYLVNDQNQGTNNAVYLAVRGDYRLQVHASDAAGQRATSAPVSIRAFLPEVVPPTIALTSAPANFARVFTPAVQLAGNATDDVEVFAVELLNETSGFSQTVTGTTNWSSQANLLPGINLLRLRSVDQAGNVSPWILRYCTYVVQSPLSVSVSGQGTVTPNLDGQWLEVGRNYRMTAKAGRGQVFAGWEGAPAQGAKLEFVMREHLSLTANFIPNPFTNASGAYAGLIWDTNTFAVNGNGSVSVQVAAAGAFTGRLRMAGIAYSFRGVFDQHGYGQAVVLRPAARPIAVNLQLDLTGLDETIRGSATDGEWVADLLAFRNPYSMAGQICPRAGNRIAFWSGSEVLQASGSLRVSNRGQVALTAMWPGGRKLTASSAISRAGQIGAAFSAKQFDSLSGWITVGLTGDLRVEGAGWLIPVATNQPPVAVRVFGVTP
jgi:plastocyanin